MADTRTLTVSLKAETASLRKGLADARNQLGLLQKSSQTTAAILKAAFAGIGFIALSNGIRSVVNEFSETATMIEDTKHLADAIGATTEEIQVLQRAAGLAEVDMDMLGRNVKMLTKNLGNASLGTGPAADMLDMLGMSANELIRMPLTEQLTAIGDRMQSLGSSAQRVAVATALFGKSGTDMIPFLMQSSQGLRDLQAEMIATGEVFSATDAAMVDEMGDSVTMAWGVWNAFKNQIVVQVAPAIKYIADLTREWAQSTNGAVKSMVSEGLMKFVDGIAYVIDSINKVQAVWYGLKAAVLLVATSFIFAFKAVSTTISLVMTGIQEASFRVLKTISVAIDNLTSSLAELGNMVPGFEGMSGTNFGTTMQKYVEMAKDEREKAWNNWGGGNNPFLKSFAQDSADALAKSQDLWSKKSMLGEQFKEMASGVLSEQIDSPMKAVYDDSLDILQEEEKIREGIADTMKETADYAKEIKDFGEGTSYRTGEYSPRVGGVFGGVGGAGAANPVGMSAAGMTASNSGNSRTGADGSIPLLQGILDATRMTAINTGRQQVPVLG